MESFSHVFPVDPMLRMHRRLWSAQNQRCYLCGKVFIDGLLDPLHWLRPTREHVHPRSRNAGKRNNVLLAHRRCNTKKDDRDPWPCEVLFLEVTNEIIAWRDYERERDASHEVRDLQVVAAVRNC